MGSVFRSCDAFRVEAVYLCGITATPPHPEIHKTALGGEDSVDWRYFASATQAVEDLRERGYCVYAIEQVVGSTKLQHLSVDRSQRYAVVFGNEVKGVHQDTVDACDGCLEIPQFGTRLMFPSPQALWYGSSPENCCCNHTTLIKVDDRRKASRIQQNVK